MLRQMIEEQDSRITLEMNLERPVTDAEVSEYNELVYKAAREYLEQHKNNDYAEALDYGNSIAWLCL